MSKPRSETSSFYESFASQKADTDQPAQEWDVSRYQDQHSFVYEYGTSLIDVANPVAGERILDVGCGSGELTAAIYERTIQQQQQQQQQQTTATSSNNNKTNANGAKSKNNDDSSKSMVVTKTTSTVLGFDLDPNMVSKAQEQFPGVTFFQADVRNFDLAGVMKDEEDDPRVDLLFSNAALHWIGPGDGAADRAVATMARAMKPGARFVVEFGGKGNVQQIVQACSEVTGVLNIWYFPSIGEFSSLLEQHGIEVTSAILYDRPTPLEEGEEGLKNWVRMFGNKFLQGLSASEIEDALDEISRKLRPTLFDGTQWTADYRRIRVVGRKLPRREQHS